MDPKALFVDIGADSGKEQLVAAFLRSAQAPALREPDTRDWYALRFSYGEFAIFDTFPGNVGLIKHLLGEIGRALIIKTFTMLRGLPDIHMIDVLGGSPPDGKREPAVALHLVANARRGREADAIKLLLDERANAPSEMSEPPSDGQGDSGGYNNSG